MVTGTAREDRFSYGVDQEGGRGHGEPSCGVRLNGVVQSL